MADFDKDTPLPIYNAIFYNKFEFYADVVKTLDYVETENKQYYNLASIIDLDLKQMNSYSNLYFLNTLNHVNIIIEQLNGFITILNKKIITNLETLNNFLRQIEKSLKKVDTIFSKILTFQIRRKFFMQEKEIKLLNLSIQEASKNLDIYTESYINSLNKDIEEKHNYTEIVKAILQQAIVTLNTAKQYIDIYYEIKINYNKINENFGANNLDNPTMKFLGKTMFNFCIPKHYIRLCIINGSKLMETIEAWCLSIKNKNLTKEFFDNKIHHVEVFEIHSISDYINVSLNHMLNNYSKLKRCKNCNKYFIPSSRTDEKYCNNPSPQNNNKTCKEYGAKKTYRDEIKSTPIKYEHNKTSQFFRMRINRTNTDKIKEKELYQKKFNDYKESYQNKKKQYQLGKLKEKDFVEWIIKQKEGVNNGSSRNNKK